MALLSVIIPVYNVASFLRQCLDSVCAQTLSDIEIICVDDCSTDNSLEILKSYGEKDGRFVIIRQEKNSGPGAARNRGMSVAGGKYIGFVDSDDWIERDYFDSMVSVAVSRDADLLFNSSMLIETKTSSSPFVWLGSPTISEEGMFLEGDVSAGYTNPAMCSHLYRRDLLKRSGCTCPEEYNMGEDKYFHIVSSMRAKAVYAYKGPAYHYRRTNGSLTKELELHNIHTVRYFRDVVRYFGDEIHEPSFKLKLYNKDLFSRIGAESEYDGVKEYLESLSRYFSSSGVFLSDFDRYAIGNILNSKSLDDMLGRIGREPWIRYTTLERIKRGRNVEATVMIPVRNSEAHIENCLRSVCSRTSHDIEILCVNDGSSDRSFDIIRQFAFEDNRIRVATVCPGCAGESVMENAMREARGKRIRIVEACESPDFDLI